MVLNYCGLYFVSYELLHVSPVVISDAIIVVVKPENSSISRG